MQKDVTTQKSKIEYLIDYNALTCPLYSKSRFYEFN